LKILYALLQNVWYGLARPLGTTSIISLSIFLRFLDVLLLWLLQIIKILHVYSLRLREISNLLLFLIFACECPLLAKRTLLFYLLIGILSIWVVLSALRMVFLNLSLAGWTFLWVNNKIWIWINFFPSSWCWFLNSCRAYTKLRFLIRSSLIDGLRLPCLLALQLLLQSLLLLLLHIYRIIYHVALIILCRIASIFALVLQFLLL
jgi:hypothetical protein